VTIIAPAKRTTIYYAIVIIILYVLVYNTVFMAWRRGIYKMSFSLCVVLNYIHTHIH